MNQWYRIGCSVGPHRQEGTPMRGKQMLITAVIALGVVIVYDKQMRKA